MHMGRKIYRCTDMEIWALVDVWYGIKFVITVEDGRGEGVIPVVDIVREPARILSELVTPGNC